MKSLRVFPMCTALLLGVFLLVPAASFAAGDADYSGKWTLNESKSDLGEGRFGAASKMSITQEKETITLERTRAGRDGEERITSETISLDGKENLSETENRKTVSVATWSADKSALTIKSTIEFNRQGEIMEIERTEILSLSEDGKVLSIQSAMVSERGDRSVTLVYDKN